MITVANLGGHITERPRVTRRQKRKFAHPSNNVYMQVASQCAALRELGLPNCHRKQVKPTRQPLRVRCTSPKSHPSSSCARPHHATAAVSAATQACTAAASVAAATTCDTSRHNTQQRRHGSSGQDISPSAVVWLECCKLVGYCCCSVRMPRLQQQPRPPCSIHPLPAPAGCCCLRPAAALCWWGCHQGTCSAAESCLCTCAQPVISSRMGVAELTSS